MRCRRGRPGAPPRCCHFPGSACKLHSRKEKHRRDGDAAWLAALFQESNTAQPRLSHTVDGRTVGIVWLLQARHRQRSLDPDVRKFVGDADEHGLVDAVEKVVVDLGVLRHTAQQFVNQLARTETHSVAADFMRLKLEKKKKKKRSYF